MTLGYYYNFIWSQQPGRDHFKDFKDLTPEELEQVKADWQEYVAATTRHNLAVDLLDEEWEYLGEKARALGLSRSGLIQQFIMDFRGLRSNGSDEEDLADEWYRRERVNFPTKEEEWI